ncbi:DNA polymerase III subunit delta' [Brassicibacter mesophilus]|uniref:DNA polymerase III subunit delta' n=1 Tax=Brassicibacter mesophilus TaxID=745119 RepID=UPI003D1BC56F
MDFNDIIGHEKIKENLQSAIKNSSVTHSYLFEGPRSIGKEKLAKVLAKTLLCKASGAKPCNTCTSCIKFDSNNHPDFFIEEPQGDSFKKEQIEEIQRSMRMLPYEGKRKVYILNDVNKMTQEAQNSFLKTLEEPPAYVVIIMTVINSYSLLPTIISRCQMLKFTPMQNRKIEEALINMYGKSSHEARFIASFSNGIIGRAISLSQSDEFKKLRDDVISIIDSTINSDSFKVFSISEFFEDKKEIIEDILDIILIWFRDLLIYKETGDSRFLINMDKIDIVSSHCSKLPKQKIHDIIEVVRSTKDNIYSKVNYQLSIEVMLLKMQEV